jgi:hypothetical protein
MIETVAGAYPLGDSWWLWAYRPPIEIAAGSEKER